MVYEKLRLVNNLHLLIKPDSLLKCDFALFLYFCWCMKHVYYLDNCTTCRKVIEEARIDQRFTFQNLKQEPINAEQLDWLAQKVGSYAKLFNRQSRKYNELGLAGKELSEDQIRKLILQEYTFLKRPVVIVNNEVFVCRDKQTVSQLIQTMKEKA